jgi:hypothetical protein
MSSIQGQCNSCTKPLSRGLDVGLIKWAERLAHGSKDPQLSANSCPSQQSNTQWRLQAYKCNVGATEGQEKQEGGRPAGLALSASKPSNWSPTPGVNQERPEVGGGHVATPLGRPTAIGGHSCPDFTWKTSSTTLPTYNWRHMLYLLIERQPWKAINRTLILTCERTPFGAHSLLLSRVGY